jgi:hypothetical protein
LPLRDEAAEEESTSRGQKRKKEVQVRREQRTEGEEGRAMMKEVDWQESMSVAWGAKTEENGRRAGYDMDSRVRSGSVQQQAEVKKVDDKGVAQ